MKSKLNLGLYDYTGYAGYIAYACCAMILSVVIGIIASDLGFPLGEGNWGPAGVLHFLRSMMIPITMISCIFLAGRYGKRRCLGTAIVIMGIGIALAACSGSYGWLTCAILVSAIGQGGFDSLITPTVQAIHEKEDPARYTNVTHAFWSVGVVSVVIVAGWALYLGVSWRLILGILGILTVIPGFIFLFPSRKHVIPESETKSLRVVLKQIFHALKCGRFWLFLGCMFLAGGSEHCLAFWCPSYIQEQFGSNSILCALGTAIYALGMVAGRMGSGLIGSRRSMFRIILFGSLFALLCGALLPFTRYLAVFYLVLFGLGLFSGPLWPSIENYCADELDGDRTTMLMLLPCIGNPGCGFFTWLMGVTADKIGPHWSIFLVPFCYLLLAILALCTRLHHKSN